MYTREQKEKALAMYDATQSIAEVIRRLGYPSKQALYTWIANRDKPWQKPNGFRGVNTAEHPRHPSVNLKFSAIRVCFEEGNDVQLISAQIGYSRASIYAWHRRYLKEGMLGLMNTKDRKRGKLQAPTDSAALAFATEIYATSLYIRREYSTEIYKVTKNGKVLYYYAEPAAGSPHSSSGIDMGRALSYGTAVAYSHTHPNSNSFSSSDISFANYYQIDAYFNGPNLSVQKYDCSTGQHPIPIATITPTPLTDEQKQALQTEFYDSWYGHIVCRSHRYRACARCLPVRR